jgi:hypothetical protein
MTTPKSATAMTGTRHADPRNAQRALVAASQWQQLVAIPAEVVALAG